MINKPYRKRQPQLSKVYTLDIETDARGQLIDIGFYDGEKIKYFQSWQTFTQSLKSIEAQSLIYAHNGGGFDYVNYLIYLFGAGIRFEAMLKQSKIFCFWLSNAPNIRFVDSFNILPTTLEKVAQSFSECEKLEIDKRHYSDMRGFKRRERELYYKYLERDCVSLYQSIIKVRELVNEIHDLGDLRLSIGGISMRLFQKQFLSEKIVTPSAREKDFTFSAYVGGRCEYLGFGKCDNLGWYSGVNGYDFNSHYPSQMLSAEYPIRRGAFISGGDFIRGDDGRISHGIYHARFEQRAGRIPLLQTVEGDYDFSGYGTFTHTELNEIEENGGRLECLCGYYYQHTAPIFDDFVNYFFEKRLDAQRLSDSARNTFYKLVLNNLYGKFGQRDSVESLKVLDRDSAHAMLEKGIELNEFYRIDDTSAFYDVKEEKKCFTAFPAIACMITASARVVLNQFLERCKNPIYCDTDSIHCQDTIESKYIGDGLGQLKVEFLNSAARYGGKKSYEIRANKIRQKGIPQTATDSAFFDALFTDGCVVSEFNRPLLLKSAIRKIDIQSPSMFAPFSRTVVRDKSLAEKFNLL